jgi:hypothetical protein
MANSFCVFVFGAMSAKSVPSCEPVCKTRGICLKREKSIYRDDFENDGKITENGKN